MDAAAARSLAQEWLQEEWLGTPSNAEGVRGAFVMGSLAALDDDEPFDEGASDIDICIVVDGSVLPIDREAYPDGSFVLHRGCIVQGNFLSHEMLQEDDRLLTMLGLGCNLRHGRILLDRDGELAGARERVLARWHEPEWTTRRTERAIEFAQRASASLASASSAPKQVSALPTLVMQLAGLVAIASRVTPTHRRALPVARRVLTDAGREDLAPRLLAALGADGADTASVAEATADALEALEIENRSPVPAAGVGPELRAVLAGFMRHGITAVAAEGVPGEAMLPAMAAIALSATVSAPVAAPPDQRRLGELVARTLERAGVPPHPWSERCAMLDELTADVVTFCREASRR